MVLTRTMRRQYDRTQTQTIRVYLCAPLLTFCMSLLQRKFDAFRAKFAPGQCCFFF